MKKNEISKGWRFCIGALLFLLLSLQLPLRTYGFDIGINLAPHIINVGGNMEAFVIHTNLPYGAVDPYTVTLNGDDNYIYAWKCDSLGYFDAIILLSDVEGTLEVGEINTFLLKGLTKEGEPFEGVDEIFVTDKAVKSKF